VTKLGVSWEKFPRKLASPSSNGSISANSCWRLSTVNLLIDFDPAQLRTNHHRFVTLQPVTLSLTS
jgi:hypothetical protein